MIRSRAAAAIAVFLALVAVLFGVNAATGGALFGGGDDSTDTESALARTEPPSDLASYSQAELGPARPLDAGPSGADTGRSEDVGDLLASLDGGLLSGYTPADDEPLSVRIPTLGVRAPVGPSGLNSDGSLAVPSDPALVGWYTPLGPFDDVGAQVLTGHVSWQGTPGAFADLGRIEQGAVVEVVTGDGTVLAYEVTSVERVAKSRAPLAEIFDPTGEERLVLMTCGGEFNARVGHYADNWIVTATPA